MWGWRGRIGHLYPAVVAETFLTDFFRVVPEGVTLAMTHLSIGDLRDGDLERAYGEIDERVGYLAEREVDCIVIGGSPLVRLKGLGSDRELIARVEQRTGIPTSSTQTAAVDALRLLGARRVAVATPYLEDQDRRLRAFLEGSDFEVTAIRGLGRHVAEIHSIPLGEAYRHVKQAFLAAPAAEAVYVPCAHFTVPSVPMLEAELGVPVVTSTHALVWAGLRMIHVRAPLGQHGRLLGTLAEPLSAGRHALASPSPA